MAGNNVYVQGSYVDIHDNEVVNLSVDKGEVRVGDNGKTVVAESGGDNDIIKEVIQQLRAEEIISHLYDYTWVMLAMNDTQGLPSFDSPQSFVTFMKNIGLDCLPSESSIKKKNEKVLGVFPDLTFIDADKTEGDRRVNVGKRFLNLYRSRVK